MPYVQCNGADIYYEERGADNPIVFLHGALCGLRFFEPQLADLAAENRPIAVDFRGHGRSEKPEFGHTVAQYARDLHAFFERRGLEDVVLVGWSLGALVSWDYVEQFGTERLRGLVDVDMEASRFKWDDYDYGLSDLAGLIAVLTLLQEDRAGFVDRFVEQVFADPSDELRTLHLDETTRVPTSIASAILFDATTRDYRTVLPEIDVPMLVCAGTEETRGPGTFEAVSHVAELVPDATVERFDGSGHCPPRERPDQFNRAVSEFVASL